MAPVLEVTDLHVDFPSREGTVHAVRGVNLSLDRGQILALVGESGSGKSVTARAMLGLVPEPGRIVRGNVMLDGQDLASLSDKRLAGLRGEHIGLVFQDPQSSLNPVMTIGEQIVEAMTVHGRPKDQAKARAVDLLAMCGVPDPKRRLGDYPHQFSGGMRQRVMIALAMANNPAVLVADEPTTALDVTVQAQILDVFRRLNAELGTAIVLITHNLGIVAQLCTQVSVMYAGTVVESGSIADVFNAPRHPYTWELLRAVPRLSEGRGTRAVLGGRPPDLRQIPEGCPFAPRCRFAITDCSTQVPALSGQLHAAACLVTADGSDLPPRTLDREQIAPAQTVPVGAEVFAAVDVVKNYPAGRGRRGATVQVLSGVSLALRAGETLGLVGESGCGKSTFARLVLGLERPNGGTVTVRGADLAGARGAELKQLRCDAQMVFQDPYASLNPRHTVAQVIGEPLRVHRTVPRQRIPQRVSELLELVGLRVDLGTRLPRQLSGGQRQRVAIARALALQPSLLVLDEPISSLDVTLQAQIVTLLDDLQQRLGVAYLFIAHDMAIVRRISHRIAVMYLGEIVEMGAADEICLHPGHPYTISLLSAVPEPDTSSPARERIVLSGDPPSPLDPPLGCKFHPRCPLGPAFHSGRDICATQRPVLTASGTGRQIACHFAGEAATLTSTGTAAAVQL